MRGVASGDQRDGRGVGDLADEFERARYRADPVVDSRRPALGKLACEVGGGHLEVVSPPQVLGDGQPCSPADLLERDFGGVDAARDKGLLYRFDGVRFGVDEGAIEVEQKRPDVVSMMKLPLHGSSLRLSFAPGPHRRPIGRAIFRALMLERKLCRGDVVGSRCGAAVAVLLWPATNTALEYRPVDEEMP